MNTTEIKVNWNKSNGKLKHELDMFTDDLLLLEVKQNNISRKFQTNLDKTEEEFKNNIVIL